MGRGRFSRILATHLAWALQDRGCTSDLAAMEGLMAPFRYDAVPDRLDMAKVCVERRLRLAAQPAFEPAGEFMRAVGASVLVKDELDRPIVIGIPPGPERSGRLIVALMEADLEAQLHALRFPTHWNDFSASCLLRGGPAPSVVELTCEDHGILLRRLDVAQTALPLATPGPQHEALQLAELLVHENLGLRNGQAWRFSADEVAVRPLPDGIAIEIGAISAVAKLLDRLPVPALLELRVHSGTVPVSVFCPSTSLHIERHVSSDSRGATPVLQLLDLLAELYSRRSFKACYNASCHHIDFWPTGGAPRPSAVRVTTGPDTVATWSSASEPPFSLASVPLPHDLRSANVGLDVTVGARIETSSLFVPEIADARPAPLSPAELGSSLPTMPDCVLESLAIGSLPRYCYDALPNDGEGAPIGTGFRGICVLPISGSAQATMREFLDEVLKCRYTARTSRQWCLIALLLFSLLLFVEAIPPRSK